MPGCATLLDGELDSPLPMGSVATMKWRVVSSALPSPMRKSRRWWVPVSAEQTRIAFERSVAL